jgi:hypothetical protein
MMEGPLPNALNLDLTVGSKYNLDTLAQWDEVQVERYFTDLGFGRVVAYFPGIYLHKPSYH